MKQNKVSSITPMISKLFALGVFLIVAFIGTSSAKAIEVRFQCDPAVLEDLKNNPITLLNQKAGPILFDTLSFYAEQSGAIATEYRVITHIKFTIFGFEFSRKDTFNLVAPDGQGGWREPTPQELSDVGVVNWELAQVEFPNATSEETGDPLYEVPVYSGPVPVGYIVNTEYYNTHPNAIFYLKSVGSSVEILAEPSSEELMSYFSEEIAAALASYSSLQITSQTNNRVVMEFNNPSNADTKFDIFNVNGTVVRQLSSSNNVLVVDGLPSGVYFVKSTTDPSLYKKIIIAN